MASITPDAVAEDQARLLFEKWLCGTGSANGLGMMGMTALNDAEQSSGLGSISA